MADYGKGKCACGEVYWYDELAIHTLSCKIALTNVKRFAKLQDKINKHNEPILKQIAKLEKKLK
jgi:hypothetical protein